jgi:capsular polysaccharide export protein
MMGKITGSNRTFLFLQGPHGPFFYRLGNMLRAAGADVWRVGFNAGDKAFWFDKKSFIPFQSTQSEWPTHFDALIEEKNITDIVLYGDTRPIHAEAIKRAKSADLTVHVFEEGYLRPYWVTYERDGINGHSRLMNINVKEMQTALADNDLDVHEVPAHWGDMRQHVFYGALYHWFVMFRNGAYQNFRPHRALSVTKEFQFYLLSLLLMPWHAVKRILATRRIKQGGFPYHLALLQLEHDSSFQNHSPFDSNSEFIDLTIEGFAKGAPRHHHLVFKAHPLEDGRAPQRRTIKKDASKYGVSDRVHYVRGGKLARLLDHARSAVTVNSTAAQQVLWRGLPIKVFGSAVYAKPEFVSHQALDAFFSDPNGPDARAYKDYRKYLLQTSQVPGGFYSARGRRQLLRQVVDMMLEHNDPYDALDSGNATPRQQFRLVT